MTVNVTTIAPDITELKMAPDNLMTVAIVTVALVSVMSASPIQHPAQYGVSVNDNNILNVDSTPVKLIQMANEPNYSIDPIYKSTKIARASSSSSTTYTPTFTESDEIDFRS